MRLIFAFLLLTVMPATAQQPLATVSHVDLNRYLGKWYELGRYPNRFEKKCARDVTAEYSLDGDRIAVRNACIQADGKPNIANGKAKVVDTASNAKLKVTFFWPFYGDYWIIGLDPDYKWAIVGTPNRDYLWILSRTPSLPKATMNDILLRITASGYDISKLLMTPQTSH